jgi:Methyltransferase domain
MQVIMNPSGLAIELPDKVGDLAKTFSSGMMDEHELTILAAASALAPANKHSIAVEIGTYVGATAVFLAKVLRELDRQMPILSIDAFSRVQPDALNPQGNLSEYLDNIKANSVEGVCMPMVALSADAAVMVPSRIGLLIVDGGHAYPIVNSDLELYTPKVQEGGVLFVDDYGPAYPEVVKVVDRFFSAPNCPFSILHKSSFVVARRDRQVAQSGGSEAAQASN